MNLRKALVGAKVVMVDEARGLTLVWHGGHGIHAYNDSGREVSFWNTGSWAVNEATESQVRESMEERIESGDYP